MTSRSSPFLLLLLASCAALCQTPPVTLPAHTPLAVQIDNHLPMRAGESIQAKLLYPVYSGDKLLLPANLLLTGVVDHLTPDRPRRLRARFNADFTPFRIPAVRFTAIVLADGTTVPIETEEATDGAPIFHLTPPPPGKGGFIAKQIGVGRQAVKDQIAIFTAPGKADRLLQAFYSELPYHPQRIEKSTAWTVETTKATLLPASASTPPPAPPTPPMKKHGPPPTTSPAPSNDPDAPKTLTVTAYLTDALTSKTAHPGQQIHAIIAEPIHNPDGTVAVPQGATLLGSITEAKPARSFARNGKIRFDFRQITLPGGQPETIQAALTGADSGPGIILGVEGEIKTRPVNKIIAPLVLAFLASRPLDQERGAEQIGKNAAGANGLGLVGNIIAVAGASPKAAAGIGFYGAAVSFYSLWIARGHEVIFPRDTRIEVQTTARHSEVLKPDRH